MTTDDPVREVLREHGLRSTGQRVAILRQLADAGSADHDGHRRDHGHDHRHGHLTVTDLHARLADTGTQLDVTTVYRTLTTLVDLGVVHAVADGVSATTYGLATDAHHHAVCLRCGTVRGIPAAGLATALSAVEQATGFDPATAGLTVHGLCAECRG